MFTLLSAVIQYQCSICSLGRRHSVPTCFQLSCPFRGQTVFGEVGELGEQGGLHSSRSIGSTDMQVTGSSLSIKPRLHVVSASRTCRRCERVLTVDKLCLCEYDLVRLARLTAGCRLMDATAFTVTRLTRR